MINYKEDLEKQRMELIKLEKRAVDRLKTYRGLEKGNLRVSTSNGCSQYHFRREGETKESYIPTYEMDRIKLLVQRDYDEKVQKELHNLIGRIERFIKGYDVDRIDQLYEKLIKGRKHLVDPIQPTSELIIKEWYERNRGDQNSFEKKYEFQTIRGELVRSKSEKMIADYFYSSGIPYVCEPEFILRNGGSVYPDFAVLNVKKNKTIYWEHLGLVDKETYASRNFNKLMDYEESGLMIGDDLIITMETQERPLDIRNVKNKAQEFLL